VQTIQPTVEVAKLTAAAPPVDLSGHGESVKTVQARLGHKSAIVTFDTYGHLWPDSEDRTRRALDDVLGTSAVAGFIIAGTPR
jgi:hypothetical protein